MGLHRFETRQLVPIGLDEAWAFFSDPRNLAVITPPEMAFEVASPLPERMHPGLIILHRVRPLFGLPVTWVTERRFGRAGTFSPPVGGSGGGARAALACMFAVTNVLRYYMVR